VDLGFPLNTLIALALGVLIGIERQWGQHPAGLRTNALVALGAALFVSVSALVGDDKSPTRIASYVVSGLGFLGGGVILRDGLNVKGLNTAATIWCSGAVGTLAGIGYPLHAIIGTVAILAVHLTLRPVVHWIDAHNKTSHGGDTFYHLRIECSSEQEAQIRNVLLRHVGGHPKLNLQGLATEPGQGDQSTVQAEIFAPDRDDRALEEIVARVSIEPGLKAVSWKRNRA
jgi:putative Mg2+ transporter-C (MgtC) family protein